MRHERLEQEEGSEARFDDATLRKVTALAQRLQDQHQETLSAREMEAIGGEVGLKPAFIRRALAHLQQGESVGVRQQAPLSRHTLQGMAAAWWAAGWTIPFVLVIMISQFLDGAVAGAAFFAGWGIYIGGGIMLSHRAEGAKAAEAPVEKRLSRSTLLELLFALQQELQGQKQHRAFLSVDVVGSSEMKRGAPELAVEYSFGQFRQWVEGVVRANGGEMHSAAGDGMMCAFTEDGAAARTAGQLLEGLPRFNAQFNHLATPFHIRCGVSAGDVAFERGTPLGALQSEVIDRAAVRQRLAQPDQVVLGAEAAAAAERELGALQPLPEPAAGERILTWQADRPAPDQLAG